MLGVCRMVLVLCVPRTVQHSPVNESALFALGSRSLSSFEYKLPSGSNPNYTGDQFNFINLAFLLRYLIVYLLGSHLQIKSMPLNR
jgi:hypothetical protein